MLDLYLLLGLHFVNNSEEELGIFGIVLAMILNATDLIMHYSAVVFSLTVLGFWFTLLQFMPTYFSTVCFVILILNCPSK
jgi:hypothetical protein